MRLPRQQAAAHASSQAARPVLQSEAHASATAPAAPQFSHDHAARVEHAVTNHTGKDAPSADSYPTPSPTLGGMMEAKPQPSSSSSSGSGDLPTHQPPTLEVSVLCWALVVWGVPAAWLIV